MTSIKRILIPMLVFSFAIVFFSCNNVDEKKDEAKDANPDDAMQHMEPVFTAFKIIIIKHLVADFDKWKPVYLVHDSMRMAYGISHFRFGRGADDPNMVLIFDKVNDVQKAKDFLTLPNLKDAMQKGGVKGKPEFTFAEVVWNDDSEIEQKDRLIISHKVKDFDTWKKAFDAEGKAKRAEYGLIDRGLARGIDDPSMVYIVFAITDKEKAKARANSEELRQTMTDAGVTGTPDKFFYKVVD